MVDGGVALKRFIRLLTTTAAITLAVSSADAGIIFNNVHSKRALYYEDWDPFFLGTQKTVAV